MNILSNLTNNNFGLSIIKGGLTMYFKSNSSKNRIKTCLLSIFLVFFYSIVAHSLNISDPTVIGEIIDISNSNSTYSITVKGSNNTDATFNEAIVHISDESIIFDKCSNRLKPCDLKKGMSVFVILNPAVTKSIPPQGTAKSIQVQNCVKPSAKGTITEISKDASTKNLRITVKGDPNAEAAFNEIIANVTSNTKISDKCGHPAKIKDLKKGSYVEVFLSGPVTSSIPPQGNAESIIIHKK